jgi:hypothetical protein
MVFPIVLQLFSNLHLSTIYFYKTIIILHCVYFSIVRAGDAIYVRVGDHDLTQKFGSPGAQTLRVATTYIHHNHNSQTLDNDIALLKLHGEAGMLVQGHLEEGEDSDTFFSLLWSEIYN